MNGEAFARTRSLFGEAAMARLASARVIIFGIGGVGGYVAEALARCGVGHLALVDNDAVSETNINRQIIALRSTVGKSKVAVMADRIRDINPEAEVTEHEVFFLPETASRFDLSQYDYVIDAIDTVAGKMQLVKCAKDAGVPIICSMGAGNKTDPTAFRVTDIYRTSVCPLAKVMRSLCRREGIKKLTVVYSEEAPMTPREDMGRESGRTPPASAVFAPAAAGLTLAERVVNDLVGGLRQQKL